MRLLKRGFAYVGWDVRTNRGVCKTPPTAAKVYEFLTKAVEKIEHFETQMAETVQPTQVRPKPSPLRPDSPSREGPAKIALPAGPRDKRHASP